MCVAQASKDPSVGLNLKLEFGRVLLIHEVTPVFPPSLAFLQMEPANTILDLQWSLKGKPIASADLEVKN